MGVGVVSRTEILDAGTITVARGLRGADAVVVMAASVRAIHEYLERAVARRRPVTHVAIEGQTIYERATGATARPEDILRLAQTAGAALAACMSSRRASGFQSVEIVAPAVWKGQVPKAIHQTRILTAFGGTKAGWIWAQPKDKKNGVTVIKCPLDFTGRRTVVAKDWGHAIDAIGLARWAVWEGHPK